MSLRINLARTNKAKLPAFIRTMYWLGYTCEESGGYLVFEPLTSTAE